MTSETLQKARDYEGPYPGSGSSPRPCYHLTPRIGWMNDPNGFSYYKGQYHLFYQYHPYSTQWGPMHWGHAVSSDLLHWTYLPCALAPDQPYDEAGCFSGSAIELPDGRHLLMYTGVRREAQPNGSTKDVQTQCIAIGDGLDYEKLDCNPVLDEKDLPEGGSRYDIRDPELWREPDGTNRCVVGDRPAAGSGSLPVYRSEDAIHWQLETVLDRCYNEFGKMWECPDVFPLDGKTVVLVSPQDMTPVGLEFHNGNGTLCLIGERDPDTGAFQREDLQAIDYGLDFYAPQTVLSPDGRRIMVAWMQNWDTCVVQHPGRCWFGQICTPRELSVQNGRLIQWPIRELETLRGRRVYHSALVSDEVVLPGVSGRVVDMTVTLRPGQPDAYQMFRIKVAYDSTHYTMITYKPRTSVLRVDRGHSGFNRDFIHERKCLVRSQGGAIQLRILLDRCSVEVFVNGGEQALSTVLTTPISADGISFEAIGGQVMMELEKYDLTLDG